jgi:Ca2+-transporting ATPase
MGFIVAVHVPIAGLALLPLLMGLPIIFWPIHIAFLEMIIDPVCSLVFEAEVEERDVMKRPPRRPDAPLFTWTLIAWSLLQGSLVFGLVASVYLVALYNGAPDAEARAMAFFSLVATIICLILVNRSFSTSLLRALSRPNPALAWVVLGVAGVLALSLFWSEAAQLFHFGPLHLGDLALTAAIFLGLLAILEALKFLLASRLKL